MRATDHARTVGVRSFSRALVCCLLAAPVHNAQAQEDSIARTWNKSNLDAIRIDFPHPPVHARNLFHLSVGMWDAWAAYDSNAVGYAYNEKATWTNITEARDEAISYAAYRILTTRYALSVNASQSLTNLSQTMSSLGYDTNNISVMGDTPAAVGNRAGQAILDYAFDDGSIESNNYADASYTPINDPLILAFSGTSLYDANRWQPLAFDFAVTQNGLEAEEIQSFIGSQWHWVRPFALSRPSPTNLYIDPGPPPFVFSPSEEEFKSNNVEVIRFGSYLNPDDGVMIDASPGGPSKNNELGAHNGTGHPTNPVTGVPYVSNLVNRADFGRVVAEFWADGPDSETPPGHWNTLANEVTDDPMFTWQFEGHGAPLDSLEWDVKIYFALNGAMHDAATAAWTAKRAYDYIRPISTIRWLAQNGQCSDPLQTSFHTNGIPLVPGLIEVVTTNTIMPGERHEHLAGHLGKIALNAWPGEPDDPSTEYSGRAWFLAEDWLPYQRDTFVTPAFPGYVSGHSTFSRAGAEVLTLMTGDAFFPGGMGQYTEPQGALDFEYGPSTNITLQWGTYYDAADEAGVSRLHGGIHVAADDFPGRIMGAQIGVAAYDLAKKYFDGSITDETVQCSVGLDDDASSGTLEWNQIRAMSFRVATSTNLSEGFTSTSEFQQAKELIGRVSFSNNVDQIFFRIDRTH